MKAIVGALLFAVAVSGCCCNSPSKRGPDRLPPHRLPAGGQESPSTVEPGGDITGVDCAIYADPGGDTTAVIVSYASQGGAQGLGEKYFEVAIHAEEDHCCVGHDVDRLTVPYGESRTLRVSVPQGSGDPYAKIGSTTIGLSSQVDSDLPSASQPTVAVMNLDGQNDTFDLHVHFDGELFVIPCTMGACP